MSLTIVTESGELVVAADGPPWQYTPEGFNTGLAANSVPLSQWSGSGLSFHNLYETQPMVAAVINKLVRQVARLPLKVYESGSQPDEKIRVRSGRLFDAINRPAAGCGPIQLKQWLMLPTALHGNGAIKKIRKGVGGPPVGFEPRDWRALEARDVDEDGWIDYWRSTQFRRQEIIQPADLVHLAWVPPAGSIGVSPLKQLGVTIRSERAAQLYQEAMFRNGARPSGGLKIPPGPPSEDLVLRAELRDDLETLFSGRNAGRPMLLPGGVEWEPFQHTAVEVELIEQRKIAREEIAACFDIPPPMVGILDQATFSNITEQHKMLFTTVLGPWLTLVEETFKAQVIDDEPAFEGQWVEFDLKEVLRGDPVKESVALRTQLQTGLLTINEGRSIINMPRVDHPDADLPMIPVNNLMFLGRPASGEGGGGQLAQIITEAVRRRAGQDPNFAKAVAGELLPAGGNGNH